MKGIRATLILIIAFIQGVSQDFSAFQQENKLYSKRELKQMARQAELLNQPGLALFFYEQLHANKPNKGHYIKRSAQLAYEIRNYNTALTYAKKWVQLDTTSQNLLLLAQLQLQLSQLPSADNSLNRLTSKYLQKDGNRAQKKIAENLVKSVRWSAKKDSLIPTPYTLDNIRSLNSSFSEHSTSFHNGFVYFITKKEKNGTENQPNSVILKAQLQGKNWAIIDTVIWENALAKGKFIGHFQPINDTLATCAICEKNDFGKTICKIGYAKHKNNKIKSYYLFDKPVNQPGFTSTQPFGYLDEEDLVIYFVSNQEGTKGGLDLFYTKYDLEKGKLSASRNLGFKVNSTLNEGYPFYKNGNLFFSSDGFAGFGGYDVMKTTGEKSSFKEPSPVFKVNSGFDELGFVQISDSTEGIFLSNRPTENQPNGTGCCDDLYHFYITNPFEFSLPVMAIEKGDPSKKIIPLAYFQSQISTTKKLTFTLLDTAKNEVLEIDQDTSAQTTLVVSAPGYLTEVINLKPSYPFTYSKEKPLEIPLIKINNKEIVLEDIFYEFDSPNLTAKAKSTVKEVLYKILINNPTIRIQINSHTDSKGKLSYNYQLSKKRAQSVVNELISLGIDSNRLVPKGWGETSPIYPNTHPNGADNPQGRAKNRRTSFIILD